MLFIVNEDRPGRIGRVGTILGEAGINIANMAVSRNRSAGRALMALTVDSEVSDGIIELLRGETGFVEARAIRLSA
jgi:D-3-phosphoglycerate dehydrogenase